MIDRQKLAWDTPVWWTLDGFELTLGDICQLADPHGNLGIGAHTVAERLIAAIEDEK